jgi:hypothetical protein
MCRQIVPDVPKTAFLMCRQIVPDVPKAVRDMPKFDPLLWMIWLTICIVAENSAGIGDSGG